jgi:hypothetical protein
MAGCRWLAIADDWLAIADDWLAIADGWLAIADGWLAIADGWLAIADGWQQQAMSRHDTHMLNFINISKKPKVSHTFCR